MNYAGLIAGLGNPGQKYARTRHNIGFMVIDRFVADEDIVQSIRSLDQKNRKYKLWKWRQSSSSLPWLLAKPLTFMNLSGRAIRNICSKYGIAPQEILIVHDELDLPFGRMRFKYGGGLAGHNGLFSIAEALGTNDFQRLRLGIGKPQDRTDTYNYVLSSFTSNELLELPKILRQAVSGLRVYCEKGAEAAMNMVHSFHN